SNRGLCGAFNANINRTISRMIRENYSNQAQAGNVKVMSIGKKSGDFFAKMGNLNGGNHNDIYANLTFEAVSKIAEGVMQSFAAGEFDKVEVVYNQFKNAAVQNVMVEQVLPIIPPTASKESKAANDYIFEPGKEELVLQLIPKSIKVQLYKAVLDSNASEHGARMTAMSKATDNAGDLLKELRLSYNKARQAAITGEILEIVAGAEALNG
ncbi:MAG TPA: ATP synthase F1 subunit gamma, partial [Bacteroidia bacterium]|nr:ATP synthase F1 subunit gamma [Bacteroidia bacterium]